MQIVFCSAEVVPFSQAGGLGDVAGSLPRALSEEGLDVRIITPMYGMIDPHDHHLHPLHHDIIAHHDGTTYSIKLWKGKLPGADVPVYFLENYELYGYRKQVYPIGEPERELEGFMVFSHAVFEVIKALDLKPSILHVHDWHTAPVAGMLAERRKQPGSRYENTRSVLTIHNLNYQGVFGDANMLRDGIVAADAVTTVSPNYAREIQTPAFGAGLEQVMALHTEKVSGILNGIDTVLYNPADDPFLTARYTETDFQVGKAACKDLLQMEMGLPRQPEAPLVGFVGRLAEQKGLDLLIPVMREMRKTGDETVQFVLLGTGDPAIEAELKALNGNLPNVRSYIGFNAALAHKIYAGADIFVMPSQFEPCGLGQLIALRYGTVPVVRGVGGLKDTVFDVRENPERGNGFVFERYDIPALGETLDAAVGMYYDKTRWYPLLERGMREDHGWGPSARAYAELYRRVARLPIHAGA